MSFNSKPVIEARNLSKRYRFRAAKGGETNIREEIYNLFSFKKKRRDTFLALDDISFKINQGESIGIIGSNGAGKSTLLKILSGITAPTSGSVTIRGSVSSILEVGTGFHPELTGRENIYLNATLHGLSKNDVRRKFDEIVAFSGVEKFLDTPLKHYSSGMQVRLAFSVIAHIETDIMITDEVLAVGDAEFQKKSMKKMKEIFEQGRTILFVSHHQEMISSLTQRCILIENGRLTADGPTDEVMQARYRNKQSLNTLFENNESPKPGQRIIMVRTGIVDINNAPVENRLPVTRSYKIFMEFETIEDVEAPLTAVIQVKIPQGYLIFTSHSKELPPEASKKGKTRVECYVPGNLLNIGSYYVTSSLVSLRPYEEEFFIYHNCLSYEIVNDPEDDQFKFYGNFTGQFRPKLNWDSQKL